MEEFLCIIIQNSASRRIRVKPKSEVKLYWERPWRAFELTELTCSGVVDEVSKKEKAKERLYSKVDLEKAASILFEDLFTDQHPQP